jgi:hypothetical protein
MVRSRAPRRVSKNERRRPDTHRATNRGMTAKSPRMTAFMPSSNELNAMVCRDAIAIGTGDATFTALARELG